LEPEAALSMFSAMIVSSNFSLRGIVKTTRLLTLLTLLVLAEGESDAVFEALLTMVFRVLDMIPIDR
jgi:hypothetical protein